MSTPLHTDGERRAYQRGYNARTSHRWPDHKPPAPPDDIARQLVEALRGLRDAVDVEHATLSPDDDMVLALNPHVEKADEALSAVSTWLSSPPPFAMPTDANDHLHSSRLLLGGAEDATGYGFPIPVGTPNDVTIRVSDLVSVRSKSDGRLAVKMRDGLWFCRRIANLSNH